MGLFPFAQGAGGRNCPPLSAQGEPGTPAVLPAPPAPSLVPGPRCPSLTPGHHRELGHRRGAAAGGTDTPVEARGAVAAVAGKPRRRRRPPCDLTAPTGGGEPRTEPPVAPGGSYPAAAAVSVLAPRAAPCPPGPRSSRRRWQPPAAVR